MYKHHDILFGIFDKSDCFRIKSVNLVFVVGQENNFDIWYLKINQTKPNQTKMAKLTKNQQH